jgi:hypothetical protein
VSGYRYVRVYRLRIRYPEGSGVPGWRPPLWSDPDFLSSLTRAERSELKKRTFRWPRERMFLSSSGAWNRAGLLILYGAGVEVQPSQPVLWLEDDLSAMDSRDSYLDYPEGFDSSGLPAELGTWVLDELFD